MRSVQPSQAIAANRALARVFLVVFVGMLFSGRAHADVLSVRDFIQLLQRQRELVHSGKITYELDVKADDGVVKAGRLRNCVVRQKTMVAFKGAKRMTQTIEKNGPGSSLSDVERQCLYDGKECRIREGRLLEIQEKKSSYSELNNYWNLLLWPATDQEIATSKQTSPEKAYYLPRFLENEGWSVTSELNGGRRVVVYRNHDHSRQLAVDPSHAYALVSYQQEHPSSGLSRWLFTYENVREVLPGMFFPTLITARHEAVDFESGAPLGMITTTLRVLDIAINNVADSLFMLDPMPGETVIDHDRRYVFQYAPQTDQTLDSNIGKAKIERDSKPGMAASYRPVFIALNAVAIMFIVAIYAGRKAAGMRR